MCPFDVSCAVYEGGKGSMQPKKLLHVGGVWRLLSNVAQSAGKGGPHTDQVLQCLERALGSACSKGVRSECQLHGVALGRTCLFGEDEQCLWPTLEWLHQRWTARN